MLLPEPIPASGARRKPLTVLVADDDTDMRLYLTTCLQGFGLGVVTVIEATDGREALVLVRAHHFDLIISDVVMPGVDGLAFCRALKADPTTASVPLLLISGETRGPPTCADGFLAKPFNAAGLRVHVERLLARPGLPM